MKCSSGCAVMKSDDLNYKSLKIHTKVKCNFCDKIFNNRLQAIKHNKDHIIIPLSRPNLLQCTTCLCYFTCQQSFNEHNLKHHNKIRNLIQFEENSDYDFDVSCNLQDLDEEILNILNGYDDTKIDKSENDDIIFISDDDEIYNVCNYDSLVSVGEFNCKYCGKIYNNRYSLFMHNTQHLKLIAPTVHLCQYCESFFETKQLRNHHINKVHNHKPTTYVKHKCTKCSLEYSNQMRHYAKYHKYSKCKICNKTFKDEETLNQHSEEHLITKCDKCDYFTANNQLNEHVYKDHNCRKVCDICILFFKNKSNCTYQNVGEHYVDGERTACDGCGNLCFNLSVIRLVHKKPIKEKSKKVFKFKMLSNTDRLKNIRQRLKMINKFK